MPNVLSPRDLVSRPDNMDETVPHTFWFSRRKALHALKPITGESYAALFGCTAVVYNLDSVTASTLSLKMRRDDCLC